MKICKELIYEDFFNIIDEETQMFLVSKRPYEIKYIKNPTLNVQFEAFSTNVLSLMYIKDPHVSVQLAAYERDRNLIKYIKELCVDVQLEIVNNTNYSFIMDYYEKLNSSKALNILYKKAPEQYKSKIKSHQNYKSDAELILDAIY